MPLTGSTAQPTTDPASSFAETVKQISPLHDEQVGQFLELHEPQSLAKGEHFMREGEVCTHMAFIVEGCFRYYYLDSEGAEHTGQFFFERGWIGDFASCITGRPSVQNFQALEAAVIFRFAWKEIEKLYATDAAFERFGRKLAEGVVIGAQQRSASLLKQSAEERYLEVLHHRPKVMARVPLLLIASYLGIQPESLSRLRARLAKEGRG
jgi:CRP/FNR family transcriptional regulator, anaerobic regulatory protein